MKIDWNVVDTILNNITFYTDTHDRYTLYAEYRKNKNCLEFYPIDSNEFHSCLRIWYRHVSGLRSTPNVGEILQYIKDESNFFEELKSVEPQARIAGNLKDGIEYFLADPLRQVIAIRDGRWELTSASCFKFLSTRNFGSQVVPQANNEDLLDLLAKFTNLQGDNLTLFAIWFIQAFSGGSHYGIMLSAERGSGKSTLTKAISKLLDPSEVDTSLLQTKLEDFQNYLANHYLATFDNVREIPTDFSDTLCTAITGGTVAKRKLFSDRDEVRLKLHNTVILNGIGIFPKESDLAERFLYFKLEKLKPEQSKSDYELKKLLEDSRPLILGCVFDLLAKASTIRKKLRPKKPTRMNDAYAEMLAIAIAMGLSETEFDRLITENTKQLNKACLGSPIVQAVTEYMNGPHAGKRKIVESSTHFYEKVKANYSGPKSDLFSRSAEFSKALKAECATLMKAGFSSLVDDTGTTGSTITIIRNKN